MFAECSIVNLEDLGVEYISPGPIRQVYHAKSIIAWVYEAVVTLTMNCEESESLCASAVYVCNLPPGCNESLLAEHFGMKGKRIGCPNIWVYRDTVTNETKGDAIVAFHNSHDAVSAVECINNTQFLGYTLSVTMAAKKDSQILNLETVSLGSGPGQSPLDFGADSIMTRDNGRESAGEPEGEDYGKNTGNYTASVGGRGRGWMDCKPWQQEGDWPCPNLSCSNINFSFRGICNRCGTARPAGSLVAIGGGLGCGRSRGRGRGSGDAGCRSGRGSGGPPGLFGPNDWNCPMCGNVNWAKRTKCNICNTTKPGYNEGGAREGRAGGYKEFDEAEIEETKRRRREMEEDDGEMYDEFGYLKKKFRAKAKAGDSHVTALASGGMGKAGWDTGELGVFEQSKEKNEDRSSLRYENEIDANRGGRNYFQNLPSSRSGQRGYESERDTRLGVDAWNIREGHRHLERDRELSPIEIQNSGSSEAWPLGRFAVKGHGGLQCVVASENDQQGEWLRGRKRLRERDRILD